MLKRSLSTLITCLFCYTASASNVSYSINLGTGYDSNPNYLTSSDSGAGSVSFQPTITYNKNYALNSNWYLQAGFSFNGKESHPQQLILPSSPSTPIDVNTSNDRTSWLSAGLQSWNTTTIYDLSFTTLQYVGGEFGDSKYLSFDITPNASLSLNRSNNLSLSYTLNYTQYNTTISYSDDQQRDTNHSTVVRWWHGWSDYQYTDLSFGISQLNSNEETYDNKSYTTTLQHGFTINKKQMVNGSLSWTNTPYKSAFATNTSLKVDNSITFFSSWEYQVNQNLSLSLSTTYTRLSSNDEDSGYKQVIYFLNMTFT